MRKSFKEKALCWILSIVAIDSTLAIYHSDTTLVPSVVPMMITMLNYLLFGIMLFLINWKQKLSLKLFLKILLALNWFMFSNFDLAVGSRQSGFLAFLLMLAFAFCEDHILLKAISYFRKYIVLISAIGILVCLDFFILHFIPHSICHYYAAVDNAFYVNYYLSYILWWNGETFRLCGTFNEPGIYGVTIASLLIMDHFNFKRKSNIILIIAACLTFSMACFSLLMMGAILYSIKNIKNFLAVITIVVAAMAILPQIENKNVQTLLSRFEYNSNSGKMKGDNRKTSAFRFVENKFESGNSKILGLGTGYMSQQSLGAYSSYKTVVIEWGYLGFALTALLFLFSSFLTTNGNRDAIVYWLCAALTMYSRNAAYTVIELFLMYSGILYCLCRNFESGNYQIDPDIDEYDKDSF